MSQPPLIHDALNPYRSVVVEACAGSGKTWLLVSRILRLLLAGTPPGEILAITYTRKAAREIEQRLRDWLRYLALADDAEVREFLRERGVRETQVETNLHALLFTARGLYENVLNASPALTVSTFHGWFATLLRAAPLDSGLAGLTLVDGTQMRGAQMREEAWQLFLGQCARQPDGAPAQALLALLQEIGGDNARRLLMRFVERRAEWQVWTAYREDGLARALDALRDDLQVEEGRMDRAAFFALPDMTALLEEYAALLERNTAKDQDYAARLRQILSELQTDQAFFDVYAILCTQAGEPQKRKPSAAQAERLGAGGQQRLLELHDELSAHVLRIQKQWREEQVYQFNHHALTAGAGLAETLARYKRERRLMDYADLESHVDRLLEDESTSAFLQARLDARYRHILLDEFQDTNPLQWRILLAWFSSYAINGGDMTPPTVFIVGDPKQSIYRFRRAEPRIFNAAADFLTKNFGASHLTNNLSRRAAPAVLAVVNRLFAAEPLFAPFGEHLAHKSGLSGRIELLPLIEKDTANKEVDEEADEETDEKVHAVAESLLRDPLQQAYPAREDVRRRDEARLMAQKISEIAGNWLIDDEGVTRPARYGDIMILTRRRSALPEFERALRGVGIPYLSVSRGGLLQTLEAADLAALLNFLVTPAADLALAHALRSPLFAASDADLIDLSAYAEHKEASPLINEFTAPNWWQRLCALTRSGRASPVLQRAHKLLSTWLEQAARLPVHDLLDRIYFEAQAMQRYRAAVPAAMWPGVRANLDAFIALALQLDAGRFPSLPRFIDELARLRQAEDEDAPDAGAINNHDEAAGRVRILTVHGAKGLEAPIVWLIDANNTHQTPDTYHVLLDWPPGDEKPRHFSLATTKDQRGERRAAIFAQEAAQAEREELNLLYVALTRTKQYFFASGIVAAKPSSRPSYHEKIAAAIAHLGGTNVFGEAPSRVNSVSVADGNNVSVPDEPPARPAGRRRPSANDRMEYGVLLHGLLERLTQPDAAVAARAPAGVNADQWRQLSATARAIIAAPHLQRFFDAGQFIRALNEVEFALPEGSVGRIDRMVESADEIWVLDYKSATRETAPIEEYRTQLDGYRTVITQIFPHKPVRCGLIFADAAFQEV